MKRLLGLIPFIILLSIPPAAQPVSETQLESLHNPYLTLRFEPSLDGFAKDIARIYPQIKTDLASTFGWEMPYRPTVVLIQDEDYVNRVSGNTITVAFAVPTQNLIVIDCSRLDIRPHRVDQILKHEMVHLLLHYHIQGVHLPRWLDEGVAQWVSDGVAELLVAPQRSLLEQALLAGETVPLEDLDDGFPSARKYLLLAYEQSRSLLSFIATQYGEQTVFEMLDSLKSGNDIHTTVDNILSLSLAELENRWLADQQAHTTWFTFVAVHIYDFLFLLGAFLTLIGFMRFLIKKRRYTDDEDE